MVNTLKEIAYLCLIFGINLYICSYLNNKLTARMELRRGYVTPRIRGFTYPVLKLFKYLSKDYKLNIWEFFIFLFSFLIWSIIPITATLVIVDIDFSLIAAALFYIMLLLLNFICASRTSYNFIFSQVTKKVGALLTFVIPVLVNIVSVVLINKTLNLKAIVNFQYNFWNIVYQPLGFLIFFISILLQLKLMGISKRNTFLFTENIDKEGRGMGRAISRLSSYMILFFLIVILIILYLGGWQNIYFIRGEIIFALKFYVIFIVLLLIDKATPGLDSYKYLIGINWRFLIPVSIVNLILTIAFLVFRNMYSFI